MNQLRERFILYMYKPKTYWHNWIYFQDIKFSALSAILIVDEWVLSEFFSVSVSICSFFFLFHISSYMTGVQDIQFWASRYEKCTPHEIMALIVTCYDSCNGWNLCSSSSLVYKQNCASLIFVFSALLFDIVSSI